LIARYPAGCRKLQIAGYLAGYPATESIIIKYIFIKTLKLSFGGFWQQKLDPCRISGFGIIWKSCASLVFNLEPGVQTVIFVAIYRVTELEVEHCVNTS
jgi:hypothetical protein